MQIIPPDAGEALCVLGHRQQLKLDSRRTAGALALWFETVPPGGGPPPHIHHAEDEIFIVLEGEITFWSEQGTTVAQPGSVVHVPRSVAHTFSNATDKAAKMVAFVTPGGFEDFFRQADQVSKRTSAAFPPPPEAVKQLVSVAPDYGLEFIQPNKN